MLQEPIPLMLHGRPEKTIRHEADRALEVEGRGSALRRRHHEVVFGPGHFAVEFSDLDGEEVFPALQVGVEVSLPLAQAQAGECLGYCVCYAAEDLGGMLVGLVVRV